MKTIVIMAVLISVATASATQYSKLSIITNAKQRGCWQTLKAFIADADLKDEWDCCQYLSDDYPQFAAATNALVNSGVCNADDVVYILTNSVDTAVADTYLRRVYDNDCKTSSGRAKWHGKLVRQIVNDATLTKTTVYEDGTVFEDRATVVRSNQQLPPPVMTNGVPARLASARMRRATETDTNVTITVKAGN